jgi:hypothetical protein
MPRTSMHVVRAPFRVYPAQLAEVTECAVENVRAACTAAAHEKAAAVRRELAAKVAETSVDLAHKSVRVAAWCIDQCVSASPIAQRPEMRAPWAMRERWTMRARCHQERSYGDATVVAADRRGYARPHSRRATPPRAILRTCGALTALCPHPDAKAGPRRRSRITLEYVSAQAASILARSGDGALVLALREGHPAAKAELFDRYVRHVERILARILGQDTELADLLHELPNPPVPQNTGVDCFVTGVRLSPHNDLFLVGAYDNAVDVLHISDKTQVARLPTARCDGRAVFNADETLVATTDPALYRVSDWSMVWNSAGAGDAGSGGGPWDDVQIRPNANELLVSHCGADRVSCLHTLYSLADGSVIRTLPQLTSNRAKFSPEGKLACVRNDAASPARWPTARPRSGGRPCRVHAQRRRHRSSRGQRARAILPQPMRPPRAVGGRPAPRKSHLEAAGWLATGGGGRFLTSCRIRTNSFTRLDGFAAPRSPVCPLPYRPGMTGLAQTAPARIPNPANEPRVPTTRFVEPARRRRTP